jgi:beta-1,4-N-acetylglucosaminyltransferase
MGEIEEKRNGLVVVTDRGGHLHDMLRLLDQLQIKPDSLITTLGPDVSYLRENSEALKATELLCFPQAFTWFKKTRLWNPFQFLELLFLSLRYVLRLRPTAVISTGASNVVPFCYFAWLTGAKIYHVENLAQVVNPSITGRLLYPICEGFYVQWEELLGRYGRKAQYKGWVL